MSANIFRINYNVREIESESFDSYVKPRDGEIWSPFSTDVHGLQKSSMQKELK